MEQILERCLKIESEVGRNDVMNHATEARNKCEDEENAGNEKMDIFHLISTRSNNLRYPSMFNYLKTVTQELGEEKSFYTTNLANILWKYQQWKEELPNVQLFYAIKANPNPVILRLLALLGSSFDCATEGEIRAALSAGASSHQIVFANPHIPKASLRYAKEEGVDLIVFDSDTSLYRIHQVYPQARLLLRFSPQQVSCKFDFSQKYGCKLQEATELLKTAKRLGLRVVGVSFHVGSLNSDPETFATAVRDASHIFQVGSSLGFCFNILDIGGGFLGSVGMDLFFRKTAHSIRKALASHFSTEVQVIAEPGCYVVCSAITLTTTIFSKRIVQYPDEKDEKIQFKTSYYLNNGIYSSFAPYIGEYEIYQRPLLTEKELLQRSLSMSTLYGQTLCSYDIIQDKILFPDMEIGESLVWINMGAYSQQLCSTFCGFHLPDSKYVFQKDSRLKTDWITNVDDVASFLAKFTDIIEEDSKMDKGFY